MARYYKKRFKARKKAASRSYRRYRRYKRYRRRLRRNYRRKICKPEVKRVVYTTGSEFQVRRPVNEETGEPKAYTLFDPGDVLSIGSGDNAGIRKTIIIQQGTGLDCRIGNKIRPVKLRVFGNVNMPDTDIWNVPRSASFRCLIVQMRYHQLGAGEGNLPNINEPAFSDWNPVSDADGMMLPETHRRFFYVYYMDQFMDNGVRSYGTSIQNFGANQFLAKSPFREGFGRNVKVLYDHVFTVGTQQNRKQCVNFRIKTKVPDVMVWNLPKPPQPATLLRNVTNTPVRNPIYICWFFIPHNPNDPGAPQYSQVAYDLNYTVELSYVDP